jgi:hypothetical protein
MIIEPDPGLVAHWQFNDGGGSVALDSSGNELHGTLKNMNASNWTGGKHCGGLYFDGVNDYVEISGFKGITGSSSRTCSAWIKTTIENDTGNILTWGSPSNGQKWMFRVGSLGTLEAGIWGGYIRGTTPINDGRWHHVTAVLDSDAPPIVGEIKLYVDGLLENNPYISSAQSINTSGVQHVLVGTRFDDAAHFQPFPGRIDEVRIYNAALTDAEIQDLYRTHALIADMEPDGDVDFDDFAHLAHYWQNTDSCDGDLTCDCIVDFDDLMILVEEWLGQVPMD